MLGPYKICYVEGCNFHLIPIPHLPVCRLFAKIIMSPSVNSFSAPNGHSHHLNGANGHLNGRSIKKPSHGFGTRAIHVGSEPNSETGAVIPSISLSTTYKQNGIGIHKVSISTRSGGFDASFCGAQRSEIVEVPFLDIFGLFFPPSTDIMVTNVIILTRALNTPALETPIAMP